MKLIARENSPQAFEDWKANNTSTVWSDLHSSLPQPAQVLPGVFYYSKKQLRVQLNIQQGYLCAYCMARLDDTHKTRVEHLQSRKHHPNLTFEYTNLLTVCNGEDEKLKGKDKKYCDNSKGSQALLVSPFNADCETHFRFDASGKVHHKSGAGKDTIKKLNLNIRKLIHLRYEAINDFIEVNNPETEDDFMLLNQMLTAKTGNEFTSFCIAILNVFNP